MFLFGLYIGRRRFFENLAAHRKGIRRTVITGLGIGVLAFAGMMLLVISGVNAARSFWQHLALGLLWKAHAWGLAAFYASSLLLLLQRRSWQRWLAPLGAVGRMALTNYLLQAGMIVPVCIGFNLIGRITPITGVLLALAVWSVQVPASLWWLKHFHFGPAEWVWRSLTYGSPQPMRIADASTVAVIA
jgi:uncharacterized protein